MFDDGSSRSGHRLVRLLWILVAITAIASLAYGIQYYLGGRVRLPVVSQFYDLSLSPNGRLAAAGDRDGRVHVWNLPLRVSIAVTQDFDVSEQDFWPVDVLPSLGSPVLEVAFKADGSVLTAVTADGQARSWAVDAGNSLQGGNQVVQDLVLDGAPYVDVDLAADGKTLATVGEDGSVRAFDLETGEELAALERPPGGGEALAVAVNHDGSLIAAGHGTSILLWSVGSGELVRTLVAYCDDGASATQKACGDADEDWLGHDEAITALAFSPDNALLTSGSADTTIVFWELETGRARWSSIGHWGTVTALTFSQDGEFLLSGGKDYKARNFRVAGGKSTAIFEGHLSTVNGTAFGPDDNAIMTVSDDGTLRAWETANQYTVHLEWSRLGLQPFWGALIAAWMLASGVLALLSLLGLVRLRIWGHILSMALFLLGPVVVLGLPLLEALSYPLQWPLKFQVAWPLLTLLAWYVLLYLVLTQRPVTLTYETSPSAPLADQLMISRRTSKMRMGIYGVAVWIALLVILYSVLRRFNLDISFMGSFLRFIMLGSGITFYVSALSIALAVILALLGALGRLSKNPIPNAASGFYISLIRGTPLLVQIYIWYLGLPRLNIVLDPIPAGILALGVNYGAYMTEIFRAGIQAVSIGQREAAHALGMSAGQTFRRIILPQAFRIVIPPIGNEFIAMMKDSSLVSVMAVQELTWRANKIGRQYFRGMETFIIAAAFYWVLTVLFQLLQGRLEERMARGERR